MTEYLPVGNTNTGTCHLFSPDGLRYDVETIRTLCGYVLICGTQNRAGNADLHRPDESLMCQTCVSIEHAAQTFRTQGVTA